MIAIVRGEEPEELRKARNRALARAILTRRRGEKIEEFSGYEVVKDTLADRVGYKCVFCEKGIRREGSPVEHFRPKAKVANEGEPEDPDRYWWLAWSWGNLLFACFRCNTDYKRSQFPRRHGTPALPEMCFDLGQEQPLLIDPSRIDPRKHIRFGWSATRNRWLPYPVDGSDLGRETITKLGLDEDDAADRYVETSVMPWVSTIERVADLAAVGGVWSDAMTALFSLNAEFQALSWDVLDHFYPSVWRDAHGVELPEIGCLGTVAIDIAFHDPPEMMELSEDLQLRIRALAAKAPPGETSSLLAEVLSVRKWRDDELARLFDRKISTIQAWRRTLSPEIHDNGEGSENGRV